jgi:DNA-binding protein HU-beta
MNKAGLIKEVSGKAGLTKRETGNVVDAIIKAIADTPSKGEKVTLVGFGTFQVMQRKARRGVNP